MRYLLTFVFLGSALVMNAQEIVGTWQLTDEKTCMETSFEKSDTEKELEKGMRRSRNAVARLITFDKNGGGVEGIFSEGTKKGSDKNKFEWKMEGQELKFLDKKAGIITQRFIVDELNSARLRIHNATRECEIREFSKVKE